MVGGVETRKGPASKLHVADGNWEGYLSHRGSLQRSKGQPPTSLSSPEYCYPQAPTTSGCEKLGILTFWVGLKAWETQTPS